MSSAARSSAVCRRVLQQLRRDRRTIGMLIVMPTVIMLIFGFSLSGEVKNVPILVDNQDGGYLAHLGPGVTANIAVGDRFVSALQSDGRVEVYPGNFTQGESGVDKGTYFASILVPANFSETVFLRSQGQNVTPTIQLYLDATKPAIRAGVQGAVASALQTMQGQQFFRLDQQLAFGGAQYSGLDVGIPSVIGFVLTFLVLLVSLLIVSRENTSGTLNRLYATPLTAFERLLGYTAALLILAMLLGGVILVVGVGIFGAVVKGSLLLLTAAAVLYALAHVLMAVFLSNFAKNELQAVQMAPLIALPSLALSGMLVPVNSLPDYIQPVAKLIPLYYGNQMFEGIMLKGYGIAELAPDFLIVGGVAALFFVLAFLTVKDRIDA